MAALAGRLAMGGAGSGMLGMASSLFKPKDVAKAAMASAAQASGLTSKIDWEQYNWPLKADYGGLIHFDLVELREKRDAGVFNMINSFYVWWRCSMLTFAVNFMSTVVLTATAQPAYSGISLLTALVWWFLFAVAGMAFVYKAYHGWAENSRLSQLMARALIIITVTLAMIQAFGAFGNINGWAGFASPRFQDAAEKGVSKATIQYWQAMTVLESAAWLANVGVQMWMTYRMLIGPPTEGLAPQIVTSKTGSATLFGGKDGGAKAPVVPAAATKPAPAAKPAAGK